MKIEALKSKLWKSCAKLGAALLGCLGAAALLGAAEPAQAVPIRVTYTDGSSEGFNDPSLGGLRRRSFEAAASVWGRLLPGTVPIEISASFDPLGGSATRAVLGRAGPSTLFANWEGQAPPFPNTYYVIGLANQFARGDLDNDLPDIEAQFNSDLDGPNVFGDSGFYYGLDGVTGGNTDFFPVVLHELGHGLGFTGLFDDAGSSQNGLYASFDRLIADGPSANARPAPALTRDERVVLFRSNAAYFAGERARAAGGGRNAKLYAPPDFSDGSSLYHTDEDTYRGAEELMTPFASSNPHDAGPITFAMFLDIGWGALNGTVTPTPTPLPQATATPAPVVPIGRPANDDFGSAQIIAGASGRVTGRNFNATKESGEPSHAANPGGASVWYRWTAPASGRASFSTAGSSFDTLLAAYTGTSVSALSAPAQGALGDDASDADRTSRITFIAVAGQSYSIAVDGYGDTQGVVMGNVALSWSLIASAPVGPPNNDFARAQVLAGTTARLSGTTLNATLQPSEPRHGGAGRSVWYRWTAPATRSWTFTTQGSNLDTVLALYTGQFISALRRLGADDDDAPLRTSSVTLTIAAGTVVYVAVDSKGAAGGPFTLSFGLAPANDNVGGAQVLAGDSGGVRSSTNFASREVGEPVHAGALGNRSVWYRWVAPANGQATWRTTGSAFDTLLSIYSGTPFAGLVRVASADNDANALTGTASFKASAGTTYWIAVDGKNASSGALALSWSLLRAPSNDLFAGAQVLAGSLGAVNGSNLRAGTEPGEPRHAGLGAGRSVWFRWVAPQTGSATFVASSTLFPPIVAAYQGTSASFLRSVATVVARDNASMTIALNVVAGQSYVIAVDSQNLSALTLEGAFSLRWNLRPVSQKTAQLPRRDNRLAFWTR